MIRLLINHFIAHHEGGLQWLDARFCSTIYQNAIKLDHPEKSKVFAEMVTLAQTARTSGHEWLTEHNVAETIESSKNNFVDDRPDLYFEAPLFNLMADGLNGPEHQIAAEYFANEDIENNVFPRMKLHGLLPRRRQAINEFYKQEENYLDAYKPLINATYTEPEFVANLAPEKLAEMKHAQFERELAGTLRIKRSIPSTFEPSLPVKRAIILSQNNKPSSELVEFIIEKYAQMWEKALDRELLKMEENLGILLSTGAVTGLYEGVVNLHWYLTLKLLKSNGNYREVSNLFVKGFIDHQIGVGNDNSAFSGNRPVVVEPALLQVYEASLHRHCINNGVDFRDAYNPVYEDYDVPGLIRKILFLMDDKFVVHKTIPGTIVDLFYLLLKNVIIK